MCPPYPQLSRQSLDTGLSVADWFAVYRLAITHARRFFSYGGHFSPRVELGRERMCIRAGQYSMAYCTLHGGPTTVYAQCDRPAKPRAEPGRDTGPMFSIASIRPRQYSRDRVANIAFRIKYDAYNGANIYACAYVVSFHFLRFLTIWSRYYAVRLCGRAERGRYKQRQP